MGATSRLANDEPRPWLLLGNPDNRRVTLFQQALREFNQPSAQVVSYREVLRDEVDVDGLLGSLGRRCGILRIESPGEDHDVERLLIARGVATAPGGITPTAAKRLRADPGRIRYGREWFAGFAALQDELDQALRINAEVRVQNHPQAIRTLFDKPRTRRLLSDRGVPVPQCLPGICSYDELREAMRAAGFSRVFVKPAWGSSASGVVAFSVLGGHARAITSLELVRKHGETRFYNNLRLSRYDREPDLRAIFDFLGREGMHVEQWLPKASQGGRSCDLRVVTFAGRPCHTVVRTSRSPITNLHLGNRRGDLEALHQAAGARWQMVLGVCEQAAAAFPHALYVGWDVLVTPGFRRAYVLEGNAFGDLLPNVLHNCRTTYAESICSSL